MKNILSVLTLILVLGTVNANVTNSKIDALQSISPIALDNIDHQYLPHSKVNKSLQSFAMGGTSCIQQCQDEARDCVLSTGGAYHCFVDFGDCKEDCFF